MKVLVTGGTGYLGRAIVRAMTARGHEAVVFARSATRSGLAGRLFDGDVRDREALRAAADGCDAVCHSAAMVSVWRRRRSAFDEVNVGGLQNVLDVARDLRIGRIVYTSSFLALPPRGAAAPLQANDYQRTKVLADRRARQAAANGVPIVTLYPGVIYGPGTQTEGNLVGRMIADHLAGRLPGIIGADRVWSYAFVDDVADGHALALERGGLGQRYALGGENRPQMRAFEILRDQTGRPLPRRIPSRLARAVGVAELARVTLFGGSPLLTPGTVAILESDWPLDSGAAEADLGYRARPLLSGLTATIAGLTSASRSVK
jgi:NAD+-dependent farnesol dehydrogenase